MKKNERLDALLLLIKVIQDKVPLSLLLASARHLSPLSKELCFGVCRHYFRLEAIAVLFVKKQPKALDVWINLLLGIYQLHYLRIPDYAVVKEAVGLVDAIKKPWAKGLTNAVLRTYCREQKTKLAPLDENLCFRYGHPQWLIKRLKEAWPQKWNTILDANDAHPPMSLRVNAQRVTREEYLDTLHQAEMNASPLPYSPQGIRLHAPCEVHALPGFDDGDVSLQDEAAQLAVSLLALKPGLRVLDACAAPGGKTSHMLETTPELAICVALDVDEKRLSRVQDNLTRLHLQATLINGDASAPETWWDGVFFDRILLDAPCSATGVIRRRPDIKIIRTEAEIAKIASLQHRLLQALWPLLAPEGLMVYATCSVMPEENHRQIAQFMAQQKDCQLVAHDYPWGQDTGHGWQILPGENNMDGFFYSILKKIDACPK